MNKDKDDVDIKVDSEGKSHYATFTSTEENINVFKDKGNAKEQNTNPEEKGRMTKRKSTKSEQDKGTNTKDNKEKGNNGY